MRAPVHNRRMTRRAGLVAATAAALTVAAVTGCDNDPQGTTTCQEFLNLPTSRQFQIAKQWAGTGRPDGPPWTAVRATQELTAACRDDPSKIVAEIGIAWFGR